MSSRRVTSVVRPAQYRSTRSVGSSTASEAQNACTSPVPTARPAARSEWENSTSSRTKSGIRDDLPERLADQLEVVALLDDRAERVRGDGLRQRRLAEEVQRARPVDGLRH